MREYRIVHYQNQPSKGVVIEFTSCGDSTVIGDFLVVGHYWQFAHCNGTVSHYRSVAEMQAAMNTLR